LKTTKNRPFWLIERGSDQTARGIIFKLAVKPDHGIELQQLWAQALNLLESGHPTWLEEPHKTQLNEANQQFEAVDPVEDALMELFVPNPDASTTNNEVKAAVQEEIGRWGTREDRALGTALRKMTDGAGGMKKSHGIKMWPVSKRADQPHLRVLPSGDDLEDTMNALLE